MRLLLGVSLLLIEGRDWIEWTSGGLRFWKMSSLEVGID